MERGFFIRELLYNYIHEDLDSQLDLDQALSELKLTEEDKIIVELMKDQYSCNEIAAKIELGPDAVSVHQKKICNLLAEKLGEEYQDAKIFTSARLKLGRELTEEEELFIMFVLRHSRSKYDKSITIYS